MKRSRVATPSWRSGSRTGLAFLTTTERQRASTGGGIALSEQSRRAPADQTASLRDTVEAITGVAQARHDVAHLIEPLVETGEYQCAGNMEILEHRRHSSDALRSRDQADAGDVISTAPDKVLNRRRQRA